MYVNIDLLYIFKWKRMIVLYFLWFFWLQSDFEKSIYNRDPTNRFFYMKDRHLALLAQDLFA